MANVGLLFPGQGAQTVGMGRALVERSSTARSLFERASAILGYDLLDICWNGPEEQLNATVHSQPALFVHSMAALADLHERQPDLMATVVAVAGLSLGEYSALSAAGALTFEDGVRLVQERGSAMQSAAEAVPSGMASVLGLTLEQVEQVCNEARLPNEILLPANLLCPGNIAVSGHLASIDAVSALAEKAGAIKTIRLPVAGAFHTEIMRPAEKRLSEAIHDVAMHPLRVPLFSNVDAQPHVQPEEFQRLLPTQLVSPVQWEASLRAMISAGINHFIEVGSGRVLAGTLKRIERKMPCECVGD
jgi:[acyl-carrier-protein] S-malonyltransferase